MSSHRARSPWSAAALAGSVRRRCCAGRATTTAPSSSAASGWGASGTTTLTPAPPATSPRTSTSSRSRPTRAGRAATRRRPRSRPIWRRWRARRACWTGSAPAPRWRAPAGTRSAASGTSTQAPAPTRPTSWSPPAASCGCPSIPPIPGLDELRRPGVPYRRVAPRRRPRGQARGGGRDGVQLDPGGAGDTADRRAGRRLPALAGLDLPEDGLRVLERAKRLFERLPVLQRLDRAAIFAFMEIGAAGMTTRPGSSRASARSPSARSRRRSRIASCVAR